MVLREAQVDEADAELFGNIFGDLFFRPPVPPRFVMIFYDCSHKRYKVFIAQSGALMAMLGWCLSDWTGDF